MSKATQETVQQIVTVIAIIFLISIYFTFVWVIAKLEVERQEAFFSRL